jgi:hypothetical protein
MPTKSSSIVSEDITDVTTVSPAEINTIFPADSLLNKYDFSSDPGVAESKGPLYYPPFEDPNLFQGDILAENPSESKTAVRVFSLWPLGIVPYSLDLRLLPESPLILNAMKEIESKTCIRFRPRLLSRDYVNIGLGSGCYSVIGRQGIGGQILSLGRGCHSHNTILHELLHAIGFEHMHSHRDRDKFLRIRYENIPRDKWRQFEVVSIIGYKTIVPFDFESVMLYGPTTFAENGKISMESKVDGKKILEMNEKQGLSKGDIDGINRLYMCPGTSGSLFG